MNRNTAAPIGSPPAFPTGPSPATPPTPKKQRRWLRWAVPVVTLLLGVGVGVAAGGADPTQSTQYRSLQSEASSAQSQARTATGRAENAEAAASSASAAAASSASALTQREQAVAAAESSVAARETAVAGAEQQAAANSIGEGTWTVGRDITPGTYRTKDAVSSGYCYWEISKTGATGFGAIVANDIVTGGFPTVTLSEGQDFKTNGCGVFVKQ